MHYNITKNNFLNNERPKSKKKKNEWVIVAFSAIILLLLLAGFVYRSDKKEKNPILPVSEEPKKSEELEKETPPERETEDNLNQEEENSETEKVRFAAKFTGKSWENFLDFELIIGGSFRRRRACINKNHPNFQGKEFIPGRIYALKLSKSKTDSEGGIEIGKGDFAEIAS